MELRLKHIFLLSVEEPNDYIFTPAGVVIVSENYKFTIFCQSSNHNLYRAAINKHTWEEFSKGVVFRGHEFRMTDLSEEMARKGWTTTGSVDAILRYIYTLNKRHLFFLEKFT